MAKLQPRKSKPHVVNLDLPSPVLDDATVTTAVKRKAVKQHEKPSVKQSQIESTRSDLPDELGRLGVLVDSIWDEVVAVREAVRVAEEHQRSVKGRLREVDDWVWAMQS